MGADSGSRAAADVEEFVSESYLASSKDIAEADESMKKLGVSGMRRVTSHYSMFQFITSKGTEHVFLTHYRVRRPSG